MRIFLPATPEMLRSLAADKSIKAPGGWAYAVTADLERDLSDLDEDGISQYAFDEAALASLRMLATIDPEYVDADHPAGVYRRVVISCDVADRHVSPRPDLGPAIVELADAGIDAADVAAIHVDDPAALRAAGEQEGAALIKAAALAIDQADLGDEGAEIAVWNAMDVFMAWYDPSELAEVADQIYVI